MKRKFDFEFEDQSSTCTIAFEYGDAEEKLAVSVEDGVPVVYCNRPALLTLAKTLIKMALCAYPDGFHVHLPADFDADKPEGLRVVLTDTA